VPFFVFFRPLSLISRLYPEPPDQPCPTFWPGQIVPQFECKIAHPFFHQPLEKKIPPPGFFSRVPPPFRPGQEQRFLLFPFVHTVFAEILVQFQTPPCGSPSLCISTIPLPTPRCFFKPWRSRDEQPWFFSFFLIRAAAPWFVFPGGGRLIPRFLFLMLGFG